MLSFWEQRSLLHTDVAIVGGGITGMSVAASIKEKHPKRDVSLFERSILPYGASTRNAGFACFGSLTEVLSDIDTMGEEKARELLFQRWMGLKITRKRLGDTEIGYLEEGGFELIAEDDEAALNQLNRVNALVDDFLPDYLSTVPDLSKELGIQKKGALVSMREEGQVDTGALMAALERHCLQLGVRIRTGAEVTSVERSRIVLRDELRGEVEVKTKETVICTNAFASQLTDEVEIQPGRGQIFITEPIAELQFRGNLHLDEGFYYLRNVEDRLLFGGARHRFMEEESTDQLTVNDRVQAHLEDQLRSLFGPSLKWKVAQRWSGIMAFGSDKLPTVKRTSGGIIVAVKMSGMGIALAGFVGEEVAGMID